MPDSDELSREECLRIIERKRKELGIVPGDMRDVKQAQSAPPMRRAFTGRFQMSMPRDVFLRRGGKQSREEALWECTRCGEIEPLPLIHGFLPAECECQKQARKQAEEERRCQEKEERRRAAYARQLEHCHSWLGSGWDSLGLMVRTFETWNTAFQIEAYMTAVRYAAYCEGTLILWSDGFGTGKTHLAAAVCQSLIYNGKTALFTSATSLFAAFSERIESHQGYSDLLKEAASPDLLVIDDLNKIGVSPFKQSVFFEVIDKRNQRKKATLITTNAVVEVTSNDITGVSEYIGPAAASRLCDEANGGIQVVAMNGPDFRRRREG